MRNMFPSYKLFFINYKLINVYLSDGEVASANKIIKLLSFFN